MNRTTANALRDAQSDLLAAIAVAAESAPTRLELIAAADERGHAVDVPRLSFTASGCRYTVAAYRERLEEFAASVKRCPGFAPGKPLRIGRDGGTRIIFPAKCAPDAAAVEWGHCSDDGLRLQELKQRETIRDRLRAAAVGAANSRDYPASWRLTDGAKLESIQREMVRRGLLDATDWDKVTADAICEAVPEEVGADMFADAAAAEPTPPVPAPLSVIRIGRGEGPLSGCEWPAGEVREFRGPAAWAMAHAALAALCHSAPDNGGYEKCDVDIEWANGDAYGYRFDAQHPATPGGQEETPDVARAILERLHFNQGHARPLHMTAAEYRRHVEDPGTIARAEEVAAMLARVAFPLDLAPPVREELPPVPMIGRRVYYTGWGPGGADAGAGIVVDVRALAPVSENSTLHQLLAALRFDVVTLRDGKRHDFSGHALTGDRPRVILGDGLAGDVETTAAVHRAARVLADAATATAMQAVQFSDKVAQLRAEYPQLLPASHPRAVGNNLRALLKAAGIRAGVRASRGGAYYVTLPATATPAQVESAREIAARFKAGSFDGMTDCYEYSRTPWGEAFGSVEYVFVQRDAAGAPAGGNAPPPAPAAPIDSPAPVLAAPIDSTPPVLAAPIDSTPPVLAAPIDSTPPVLADVTCLASYRAARQRTECANNQNRIGAMMKYTIIQTRRAQPKGQYRETAIDADKVAAEFRLTAVGRRNSIIWRDGRHEYVTDVRLAELQARHRWAADF